MKIAINTGGGDAPGLNAVIRAATLSALELGWEVWGIRNGYQGLLDMTPDKGLISLTREKVRGITHLGGTILGTANRGNPFEYPVKQGDTVKEADRSDEVIGAFKARKFDALMAIGGDGSIRIAAKLMKKGLPVVCVPKTIDNDIPETVATFGFDTAVSIATEAIDRLHSTAESHRRIMIVELMGRYAGWIALNSGVSATADVILIPEIPFDVGKVCEKIMRRQAAGREFSIVVVAEGAKPKGESMKTLGEKEAGREIRLGGIGEWLEKELQARTGKEARSIVLGHLQRGGGPTTFDRLISLRFGSAAIRCIKAGQLGVMVALDPPTVKAVPLDKVAGKMKSVPLDCDTIVTARDLGICFGD